MATNTAANYLLDLGFLLRERALEARSAARATVDGPNADLELGRLSAYYEVLSLMAQQARAFNLSPRDVGMEGFDPDVELISP